MVKATERLGNYLTAYGEVLAQGEKREPVWLRQLREDAWSRFDAKGFPTTHDEDWRFTNIAALARMPFRRAPQGNAGLTAKDLERFRFAGAACQMVFVNGRFAPTLSELGNLPKGLEVCPLARALDCGAGGWAPEGCAPEGIEQHLGRYADVRRDVFAALNTALFAATNGASVPHSL